MLAAPKCANILSLSSQ